MRTNGGETRAAYLIEQSSRADRLLEASVAPARPQTYRPLSIHLATALAWSRSLSLASRIPSSTAWASSPCIGTGWA